MDAKTILILPPELMPASSLTTYETPYGSVQHAGDILVRTEGVDARALIYAAKGRGARRVLSGEVVQPISPLLEPGDLVIPHDTIDQTRLRPFTFFVGKGYGFIKLNPPFCPHLMQALRSAAREVTPRTFKGAVYVATDGPRTATTAELRLYRQWGADLVGTSLLPEAYLARELELCYAALTVVGEGDLHGILQAVAVARIPTTCGCDQTMQFMKAQGVVGEDWRTWL